MDTAQISQLRAEHYNAEVVLARRVHEELLILRVRPDDGVPPYLPGQYTTLGLGLWEPRSDGVTAAPESHTGLAADHVIRRAYSIGAPLLDDSGRLVRCAECDFIEFYVAFVQKPTDDPPPLTPRLFALQAGDRLFVGPKPHGRYTLEPVGPDNDVIFAATGTGEAPHNAMVAELLATGHRGRIASITCARYRRDLAYVDAHRILEQRFSNYRYLSLTTREPENLDSQRPDYAGKRYLQDEFEGGHFEHDAGWKPDPERTHVYLCGNPVMIGLPKREPDGQIVFPEPPGMSEVLTLLGFRLDQPRRPGNIHFEKYW